VTVAEILEQAKKLTPEERDELAGEIAALGEPSTLIQSHKAWEFIESMADPIDKRFLTGIFVSPILRTHSVHENIPRHPKVAFDMLFYVHVVYDFIKMRGLIKKLLDGDLTAGDWFTEDGDVL
jgi:hypothetical protein